MQIHDGQPDPLAQWFQRVQGEVLTHEYFRELDDLVTGLEADRPLTRAQMRALERIKAALDDALDHGFTGDALYETAHDHLESVCA